MEFGGAAPSIDRRYDLADSLSACERVLLSEPTDQRTAHLAALPAAAPGAS
jgi:hypothetical protein